MRLFTICVTMTRLHIICVTLITTNASGECPYHVAVFFYMAISLYGHSVAALWNTSSFVRRFNVDTI